MAAAVAAAGPSRKSRLILETRGAEGVALTRDGRVEVFPVDPVAAEDATGAGDTFLGGFLASLIGGNEALEEAVAAGAAGGARELLVARELAHDDRAN